MRISFWLCLAGCGASSTPCEQAWWLDADGDGFGGREQVWIGCEAPGGYAHGPQDCHDGNPDRYPGAPERCNGTDDDCDGAIDNDPVDPSTFYEDADGDGYGRAESTRQACTAPDGWVDNADDCDDTRGVVHPGNEETCDALDRDCDGDPEQGAVDGELWFADADGDGHGDPDAPESWCDDPGTGWSAVDTDCDDTDADVSPDAVEAPVDGVDSDCDGAEACPADRDGDGWGGDETIQGDLACTVPGAVTTLGDCDDTDAEISPDATEVPYNGVDEDCDPGTPDDDVDGDGYIDSADCDDADPLVNPSVAVAPMFTDITASVGLDQVQWDPLSLPPQCAGGVEWMAGAAAIADYDQDGRMDLFLTRTYLPDLLYRQLADGTYEEVGAGAGVDWAGASNGAVWLDIDADGDLDLYVGMVGAESARLYVNDGTGLFSEEAVLRGADVAPVDASTCARTFSVMAGDADMDGDVDLFTTAWQFMDFEGNDRGRLLLNDGTGHFTDATVAAGLDTSLRAGFAGAWLDVDADGDRDLAYVADFGTSGLFMNDGAGAYTEVTATSNVGTDENGMGADWGDVDGDGDLDWFITSVYDSNPCVANWGCSGNRLFLNDGTGQFTDGTDLAGLRDGAWGWGAAMFDLDHDGDLDIAQQNGMPHDGFYEDVLRLWVNDGTGAFEDRACSHDVEYAGQGRAVIPFDHDNDGDLDLLLTFTAELPRLLRNDGADGLGAWLRVALDDPGSSNPHGIGATVRALPVYGPAWIREVHLNATFLGNGPAEAHFGLAGESAVDLEITWPDGAIQLEPSVATDQVLTVVRTVP